MKNLKASLSSYRSFLMTSSTNSVDNSKPRESRVASKLLFELEFDMIASCTLSAAEINWSLFSLMGWSKMRSLCEERVQNREKCNFSKMGGLDTKISLDGEENGLIKGTKFEENGDVGKNNTKFLQNLGKRHMGLENLIQALILSFR